MKKIRIFSLLFSSSSLLPASSEKPNFQDDIIPVFEQSCNSCHNPDKARGGLDLTSMNGILAGGSSGEVALPGEPDNSLVYTLAARLQEPHMPPRGEKIEKSHLTLIHNWISQGMLPTASGKPIKKKKSSVNLALGSVSIGKPDGPPPMPKYLAVEPFIVTDRAFAPSAMATAPWSPLVALAGQKQVLLYNTNSLEIAGILPYEEGFIESLNFSRNGKLIIASGGRGGKSGNVVGWEVESGKKVLNVGEEQDTVITADISADQSLVAIGGTSKLIKVFDLSTNEILYKIKKHSEWVTQVSFSPDGILLATADRNGGIYVWEAKTGNPFYSLDGHKKEITSLSWRADGNVLLSASEDGAVRTWEMINGKQVKTWNAHNGGTLSAHYAKNGNIVTSGRDKIVKFWDGNGKALKTISGFADIVMESRLSHDGLKIIAGDWTGKVGIWRSTDGKFLGRLNTNPPTIQSRIKFANNWLSNAEKKLLDSKQKLAPLKKKVEEVSVQISNHKVSLENLGTELKNSIKITDQEKVLLDKANVDLGTQTKLQTVKAQLISSKKEELSKNQSLRMNQLAEFSKLEKAVLTHSQNLIKAKEVFRKLEELYNQNKNDSNSTLAFNKAKESMVLAEKKLASSKKSTGDQKAKINQTDKIILNLNEEIKQGIADLNQAKLKVASAQAEKNKREQSWKRYKQIQSELIVKRKQAESVLSESQKLHTKHLESTKEPMAEVSNAQNVVTLAKRNLSRWEAEIINSHRHSELKKLNALNQELNEFTELFENAKKVKIAALDALNKIQSSMQSLPSEITKAKNLIAEKKQTQALVEKKQVSIIQLIEEKKVFISGFDSITETSKNFAVKQKSDSILQQANSKLIESMSLFKKDFADTQNQLASVQEELLIAKQAVNDAEKNYQGKIKNQNSMPSLIEQKKQVLSEATNKFATAEKEFNSIVSKIDKQTKVTLDLLNKYTRLLPEKN